MSLIHQDLYDSYSDGKGKDTRKFDVTIDAAKKRQKKRRKKGATKANTNQKAGAISTFRRVSLRQKALCETYNYVLG